MYDDEQHKMCTRQKFATLHMELHSCDVRFSLTRYGSAGLQIGAVSVLCWTVSGLIHPCDDDYLDSLILACLGNSCDVHTVADTRPVMQSDADHGVHYYVGSRDGHLLRAHYRHDGFGVECSPRDVQWGHSRFVPLA